MAWFSRFMVSWELSPMPWRLASVYDSVKLDADRPIERHGLAARGPGRDARCDEAGETWPQRVGSSNLPAPTHVVNEMRRVLAASKLHCSRFCSCDFPQDSTTGDMKTGNLIGVQEVPNSNLGGPTSLFKSL